MKKSPVPYYAFRNAAQILTFHPGPYSKSIVANNAGILEHSTIVTHRGRIAWIGPDADYSPTSFSPNLVIEFDVSDSILMPGLIDPHTHLLYGGHRVKDWIARFHGLSYKDITARGGGIASTIAATQHTRDDVLREVLLQRLDRIFAFGVTTVEIKTGYGFDETNEFRMLRILHAIRRIHPIDVLLTFLPAHGAPNEAERNGYIEAITNSWIPRVGQHHMAQYVDAFCDDGFFSVDETLSIIQAARSAHLFVRLHGDELSRTGLLRRIDNWRDIHSIDHLEYMNPEDARLLAENEVAAGLLPATCFHMGLPDPPLKALQDAGVIITIGTDHNPGTNPVLNPWYSLWLACIKWNFTPLQALAAMTINAAYSFRIHGRVGRLARGLRADFIIVDVPHYGFLTYQWDLVPIRFVVKNGRPYRITENAKIIETYREFEPASAES